MIDTQVYFRKPEKAPPLFATANNEAQVGREILDALEGRYHRLLEYIRGEVRAIYLDRMTEQADAHVTADDARAILESMPNIPPASKLSRNFLGQVFRRGGWECCGMTNSTTKGSHGNLIRKWRLAAQQDRRSA